MLEERWLPVASKGGIFAGRYDVSNFGNVRANLQTKGAGSRPGLILRQPKDRYGYPQVDLYYAAKKRTRINVHRLVSDAFIGDRPDGHQVNHIDGDKTNNRLENLEFVSNKENSWHAARVISEHSHVVVHGERMSIPEAIHRYGAVKISSNTVRCRISKHGWSAEQALSTPVRVGGRRPRISDTAKGPT